MKNMKKVGAVLAAFVVMSLVGCRTTGSPIQTERIKSIIPGKTSRSDLLDMLGTPVAVVARDEIITIPLVPAQFSYSLRADAFFALFSETKDQHKIYYYYYSVSSEYPVPLLVYYGFFGKTKTDRLWVLVNENTGIVEDYAFKRYGEDTVFGRYPIKVQPKVPE